MYCTPWCSSINCFAEMNRNGEGDSLHKFETLRGSKLLVASFRAPDTKKKPKKFFVTRAQGKEDKWCVCELIFSELLEKVKEFCVARREGGREKEKKCERQRKRNKEKVRVERKEERNEERMKARKQESKETEKIEKRQFKKRSRS